MALLFSCLASGERGIGRPFLTPELQNMERAQPKCWQLQSKSCKGKRPQGLSGRDRFSKEANRNHIYPSEGKVNLLQSHREISHKKRMTEEPWFSVHMTSFSRILCFFLDHHLICHIPFTSWLHSDGKNPSVLLWSNKAWQPHSFNFLYREKFGVSWNLRSFLSSINSY